MRRTLKTICGSGLVLFTWSAGFTQNLSNRGTEFWVGYGHHQFMEPGQSNSQEMVLYFSAEPGQPANVTVTVRGRTATQVTNYFVPAGTVIASNYMPKSGANDCRLYDLPPAFGGNGGEGVYNLSIHIESDVPIVAYAHTFGSASSGATMLMPVETYGYSYVSINSRQRYANNCFSWAYAVATEDNTVLEVTPSVLTRLSKPAGVPFTVTLNKGQIFQIIGANPSNGADALEVSGTRFKSIANASGDCYPIAVFSGSSRTTNPISCGSGGGDNDNQQLFPTRAWGKRYLTTPTSRSTAANQFQTNSYKVLVKDPATVVKRNGVTLTGLQQNSFYFFESGTADLIEADQPIMVAQFMTGGSCMGGGVGDPEMIYISPLEQGIKRIGFYRNTRENIVVNYLTLVIPNNGLPSLRIDGSPAFDHSYAHPRLAGYTVVIKRWSSAQSQAIVYSDSAFTAITYGLGSVESYGYNAGTFINNLNAVSSVLNLLDSTAGEHQYTCEGSPVKLSVLMRYEPSRIDWELSSLGAAITPNADYSDLSPVVADTVIRNGISYFKYELPGTYRFNWADTFILKIWGYHPSIENCYNKEDLYISFIVNPKPVTNFSWMHTGCTLDTVYFNSDTTTANNYTIRDYIWTLPGPDTLYGQSVNALLPAGMHTIGLDIVTDEGCAGDTTRDITIYDKPPADFQITPPALCEGNAFTITDTSSATIAVNEWFWDFGNGYTETNTTGPSTSYTYPGYGTYTLRHVAKSSATCISDTVSRVVTVYANPSVSFTNNASGCLDPAGLVQFSGNANTADGQAISLYAWNFGDPNANAGNPDTSNLQNPSHNYQQGTYTINFSASTVNGCVKDTTETVTFNLKPSLTFQVLNSICENSPAVSVASASVTNGVTGTGIYEGPGTNAAGMFDPAAAGFGTHTIWYKFTSDVGCVDSISRTILVHAKPQPAFSWPNTGCLPANGQVQFSNNSTIGDGQTMNWLWNFNDPNANAGNPNSSTLQNPTHNFLEGNYNVNLQITSSNGCVKDTTISTSFAVTPALSFPVLPAVCQNPGAATIGLSQGSVTNGVTGSGLYSGTGVVNGSSFDPNIAGEGIHTITYSFTSTGGCTQSATSTIEVYPRPTAVFNVNNNSLCLGNAITLTDASTISSGSIIDWQWNFGDGNTASYTNGNTFNFTYVSASNYNISLTTISDRGCFSEPSSLPINIRPIPVADFILPVKICLPDGNASFVNQSTVTDNSSLTYTWDFGDGFSSTATNPVHTYTSPGSYNVTLTTTSAFGCVNQVTKLVNDFYNKPVAGFSVNPQELCQGTDNMFSDGSTAPGGTIQSWNWNFGDGSTSAQNNPVKQFTNPGTYTVSLSVTNNAGCVSDPFVTNVTVHLQPVIDAGRDYVLPEGTVVSLKATANSGNLNFTWSPPIGLSNPTLLNPDLTVLQDQVYTLTAVGNFGCTASDQMTVKILKKVNVPNVFSPNGDNIHDTWLIPNLADYPGVTVEVFNRYGQQVMYSAGYNVPWDGRHKGKDLPVGTYYYVIQLQNGFKPLTGSVTIIR